MLDNAEEVFIWLVIDEFDWIQRLQTTINLFIPCRNLVTLSKKADNSLDRINEVRLTF